MKTFDISENSFFYGYMCHFSIFVAIFQYTFGNCVVLIMFLVYFFDVQDQGIQTRCVLLFHIYTYKTWILSVCRFVCLSLRVFRSHQMSQHHDILALGIIWANFKHDEAQFLKPKKKKQKKIFLGHFSCFFFHAQIPKWCVCSQFPQP